LVTIVATIFFEKKFWVGTFERTDKDGYAVARHIFGGEPSDAEVYEFVQKEYLNLKFGEPQEFDLKIKRMNPKRLQREVKKEMERFKESSKPSSHSQDYMREELEKKKIAKKSFNSKMKAERKDQQFQLKQDKKKQKKKGH